MNIAILIPGFPPKWMAGTEIATYHLAQHLAIRSHEVHVITTLDTGLPKESKLQGFYVHRIRSPNIRFLHIPILWLRILFLLNKLRPDIVHMQGLTLGLLGYLVKKLLKKYLVLWGRGSDVYEINMLGLLTRFMVKVGLKNADAVIALTMAMKTEMKRFCNRDIFVIPNGIDLGRFNLLSREKARHQLQITEDVRAVLWVGNMNPWKGLKYLIEAMNVVRFRSENVKLILIGDGVEKINLDSQIKSLNLEDFVIFTGKVPNDKVLEYMTATDIFTLPSLTEGFPMVILEAMGSGLPIIATNVKGLSEIVVEGENGFLVEPKNPDQIANEIILLVNDDKLRRQIAENNKAKARRYSWDIIIDMLEGVYSLSFKTLKNVSQRS